MFIQHHPPAGPTIIRGNVTGLAIGRHGFHIHQSGDLRNGCEKLGGHFDPFSVSFITIVYQRDNDRKRGRKRAIKREIERHRVTGR